MASLFHYLAAMVAVAFGVLVVCGVASLLTAHATPFINDVFIAAAPTISPKQAYSLVVGGLLGIALPYTLYKVILTAPFEVKTPAVLVQRCFKLLKDEHWHCQHAA